MRPWRFRRRRSQPLGVRLPVSAIIRSSWRSPVARAAADQGVVVPERLQTACLDTVGRHYGQSRFRIPGLNTDEIPLPAACLTPALARTPHPRRAAVRRSTGLTQNPGRGRISTNAAVIARCFSKPARSGCPSARRVSKPAVPLPARTHEQPAKTRIRKPRTGLVIRDTFTAGGRPIRGHLGTPPPPQPSSRRRVVNPRACARGSPRGI